MFDSWRVVPFSPAVFLSETGKNARIHLRRQPTADFRGPPVGSAQQSSRVKAKHSSHPSTLQTTHCSVDVRSDRWETNCKGYWLCKIWKVLNLYIYICSPSPQGLSKWLWKCQTNDLCHIGSYFKVSINHTMVFGGAHYSCSKDAKRKSL